jgi:signal peptidase I
VVSERKYLLKTAEVSENVSMDILLAAWKDSTAIRLEIAGASMHPLFSSGDKIEIQPMTSNQLRIGDIVVYRLDSKIYSHRLLKKTVEQNDQELRTKGDANLFWDNSPAGSTSNSVLGKAIAIEKRGKLINFTSTKWQWAGRLIALASGLTGNIHNRSTQKTTGYLPRGLMLLLSKIMRKITAAIAWLSLLILTVDAHEA